MKTSKLTPVTLLISVLFVFPLLAENSQKWHIIISPSLQQDEAITVAINDLVETGEKFGLLFRMVNDGNPVYQNSIIVGNSENNKLTAKLIQRNLFELKAIHHEQGYEIVTRHLDGKSVVIVAGNSIIGHVYGLYWIWDRLRVYKEIPDINERKIPAFDIRMQPQAKGSSNNKKAFVVEPGIFQVMIGRSSLDIRTKGRFRVN